MRSIRSLATLALGALLPACGSDRATQPGEGELELASVVYPPGGEPMEPDRFVEWYASERGLAGDHEILLEHRFAGPAAGGEVWRYGHWFHGLPVSSEGISVYVRDGAVTGAVASVTDDISLDLGPALSEGQAAAAGAAALAGLLRVPLEKIVFDKEASHHCQLGLETRAEEGGREEESGAAGLALEYVCVLVARWPYANHAAFVDARDGQVRRLVSRLASWGSDANLVMAPAAGETAWHGQRAFNAYADTNSGTSYLASPRVWSWNGAGTLFAPAYKVHYTSQNGLFTMDQAPGVAAYWGATQTLDYLASVWALDPLAAGGLPQVELVSQVMASTTYDPTSREIWLQRLSDNPVVDETVLSDVAHEMGHLTAHAYQLLKVNHPTGEYGALQESFADVLGELVEEHVLTGTDWIAGSEYIGLSGAEWRNFANPHQSSPPQPMSYVDAYYVSPNSSYDNGGVHINAGMPNLWFYLLANGNTMVVPPGVHPVKPIGSRAAYHIFIGMLAGLQAGQTFLKAADTSDQTARQLCGPFSQEVISVHNAWHAVGVLSAPVSSFPYSSPWAAQTGVHPWPTRFSWQAQGQAQLETAWQIQVSTDISFPPEKTIDDVTVTMDVEYGIDVGFIELYLEEDTPYYWRVRPFSSFPEGVECWRPIQTFTTGNAAPVAISPSGGGHHPWELPFVFTHNGATDYEIQIASDQSFSTLEIPTQTMPANFSDPDQWMAITLRKQPTDLFWRVRGVHKLPDQPPLVSEWSNVLPFVIVEPEVKLMGPAHQTTSVAWPIFFTWEYLRGAEFTIDTVAVNGAKPGPEQWSTGRENWLTWYQNADGSWLSEGHALDWKVSALGPPIGGNPSLGEGTREPAKPSPTWRVVIDGGPTQVQVSSPTGNPPTTCVETLDDVTLTWPLVSGATDYDLWRGIADHCTTGCQMIGATNTSPLHWDWSAGWATMPVFEEGGKDGVAFQVRAFHDTVPSVAPSDPVFVAVRPSKPELVAVYPDPDGKEGSMDFDFTTAHAYQHTFRVKLYEGGTCDPGSLTSDDILHLPPDAPNGTFFGGTTEGLSAGTYSIKVRSIDSPWCATPEYSDCVAFEYEDPEPEPEPNIPHVKCGEAIFSGGNEGLYYILDFDSVVSGEVRLNYNHYCVPDNTTLVTPGNTTVLQTGCTGTGTWTTPSFDQSTDCVSTTETTQWYPFSNHSYLVIKVLANCLATPETWWDIQVECNIQP